VGQGWYQKRRSCIRDDVATITRESAGITPEISLWETAGAVVVAQKPAPGADRLRATGSRSSSASRTASRTDCGFRSMPATRDVEVLFPVVLALAAGAGLVALPGDAFAASDFAADACTGGETVSGRVFGTADGIVRGVTDGAGGGGLPAALA
jgi:hypothetical protein